VLLVDVLPHLRAICANKVAGYRVAFSTIAAAATAAAAAAATAEERV
jgi:hypothetical protein